MMNSSRASGLEYFRELERRKAAKQKKKLLASSSSRGRRRESMPSSLDKAKQKRQQQPPLSMMMSTTKNKKPPMMKKGSNNTNQYYLPPDRSPPPVDHHPDNNEETTTKLGKKKTQTSATTTSTTTTTTCWTFWKWIAFVLVVSYLASLILLANDMIDFDILATLWIMAIVCIGLTWLLDVNQHQQRRSQYEQQHAWNKYLENQVYEKLQQYEYAVSVDNLFEEAFGNNIDPELWQRVAQNVRKDVHVRVWIGHDNNNKKKQYYEYWQWITIDDAANNNNNNEQNKSTMSMLFDVDG